MRTNMERAPMRRGWAGSRAAFTLVELLVVVSIISVLAAMLLPTLAQARQLAKQTDCLSNEKQLGAGLAMYADDYGVLPAVERTGLPYWWTTVYPYVAGGVKTTSSYPQIPVLRCKVQAEKLGRLVSAWWRDKPSYGMNGYLGPDNATGVTLYRRFSQLRRPSVTLGVSEAGFNSGTGIVTIDTYWLTASAYEGAAINLGGTYTGGVHAGKNNILWMDLHVASWTDIVMLSRTPYTPGSAKDAWRFGLP